MFSGSADPFHIVFELEATLNNTEHRTLGESHHGHIPYWKRAHHDWRFWIGLF